MTPAVSLDGVGRRFARRGRHAGEVTALADVSLQIPVGSRFGVVGESGSGKSTLMRLIAGLDQPTQGTVDVLDRRVSGRPERELTFLRRNLHMVFQDPMSSLDPRMRIEDIVAEPLLAAGQRQIAGRVREVLTEVGLDASAARRYPHQFSGGQRQRISIARAIVARPRIVIADEAVSALDVTIRTQILEVFRRISERDELTLIFVSHDLSVVRSLCDRVAVLQAGRLVEVGPTERVYRHPENPYTSALLAAVPTLNSALAAARQRSDDALARGEYGRGGSV